MKNKEYWEKVTFGIPFSDFLKEKGITEQDIINGKIAFKDIISEQKINFQQSDFKNISTFDVCYQIYHITDGKFDLSQNCLYS